MPDWEALVSERLRGISLDAGELREVIAELAGHLEETFEQLRRQGLPEEAAAARALSQVENWPSLRRRIQLARSKGDAMTNRVKQLWVPGFLTLALSMVLLMAIQFIGPKPLIVSPHGWRMIAPVGVIYIPWLLSLLPIGAMGAYLAGRAGASPRAIILSTVFPVLPYAVLFIVAFPVSVILDDHVAHNIMLSALLMGLLAWVLFPGAALLLGGLAVRILKSHRSASGAAASA
jgi:hypothetical protein